MDDHQKMLTQIQNLLKLLDPEGTNIKIVDGYWNHPPEVWIVLKNHVYQDGKIQEVK